MIEIIKCPYCNNKQAYERNDEYQHCERMEAWIEEAKDMILSNNLHQTDFYREGAQFKRLIEKAPYRTIGRY